MVIGAVQRRSGCETIAYDRAGREAIWRDYPRAEAVYGVPGGMLARPEVMLADASASRRLEYIVEFRASTSFS